MINYNEGDKVVYFGFIPFILGDGQRVDNPGDEVTLLMDMPLQKELFKLVSGEIHVDDHDEINIDNLHEEALIENEIFDDEHK